MTTKHSPLSALKAQADKIAETLNVSTATINRGAASLHEDNGGWQLLLKLLGYPYSAD